MLLILFCLVSWKNLHILFISYINTDKQARGLMIYYVIVPCSYVELGSLKNEGYVIRLIPLWNPSRISAWLLKFLIKHEISRHLRMIEVILSRTFT